MTVLSDEWQVLSRTKREDRCPLVSVVSTGGVCGFSQSDTGQFSTGMTMLTVRMVTSWSVIPEALREVRCGGGGRDLCVGWGALKKMTDWSIILKALKEVSLC